MLEFTALIGMFLSTFTFGWIGAFLHGVFKGWITFIFGLILLVLIDYSYVNSVFLTNRCTPYISSTSWSTTTIEFTYQNGDKDTSTIDISGDGSSTGVENGTFIYWKTHYVTGGVVSSKTNYKSFVRSYKILNLVPHSKSDTLKCLE